jgi:hypothetical protein
VAHLWKDCMSLYDKSKALSLANLILATMLCYSMINGIPICCNILLQKRSLCQIRAHNIVNNLNSASLYEIQLKVSTLNLEPSSYWWQSLVTFLESRSCTNKLYMAVTNKQIDSPGLQMETEIMFPSKTNNLFCDSLFKIDSKTKT